MTFNVEKIKAYSGNSQVPAQSLFNVEKIKSYGQPKVGPDNAAPKPLDVSGAYSAIKQRRFEETSVRLPFSQQRAKLSGPISGGVTRFGADVLSRWAEGIVTGGAKSFATIKGENVSLPSKITHEPTLFGGEPVTQQVFEPMSRAALNRINQLDQERPDKRLLNLLQGATEEVFLPLLNAVDIIGIGSLTTRLARKLTLSKEASQSLDNLGIGFLDDTSEEGIKKGYSEQVQKNINLLATEKVTPKEFVKKMDEIGASLDSLAPDKTTTRFGKVGERINRIATALEAERKISRAVDTKVANAPALARNATRNAERTRLPVNSSSIENSVPISTPNSRYKTYRDKQGYEGYVPDNELPTIEMGNVPKKAPLNLPVVDPSKTAPKIYDKAEQYAKKQGYEGYVPDNELPVIQANGKDVKSPKVKEVPFTEMVPIVKAGDPINIKFAKAAKAKIDNAVAQKTATQTANNVKFAEAAQAKIDDAVAKKTTTEAPTAKEAVKETAEKPKQKVSKLATRINEDLPEGQKISEFYDVEVIKEELETAAKEIEKDATKALADAMDRGQKLTSRVAKLMEFAQNAKEKGDIATQTALLSKMRVLGTEVAQGLNMFKAYGFSNPETDFMYKIVEARLSKITISAEDIAKAGSRNKAYTDKVYAPVKKEVTRKMREAVNIKAAQDLFDELMC